MAPTTDVVKIVLAIICALLSLVFITLGIKKFRGKKQAKTNKDMAEKAGPQLAEENQKT